MTTLVGVEYDATKQGWVFKGGAAQAFHYVLWSNLSAHRSGDGRSYFGLEVSGEPRDV
jgi:hypothetical protein